MKEQKPPYGELCTDVEFCSKCKKPKYYCECKEQKTPLSEKRKKLRIDADFLTNAEIYLVNAVLNEVEKQDKQAVKDLKEEVDIVYDGEFRKRMMKEKIDKIFGSFDNSQSQQEDKA